MLCSLPEEFGPLLQDVTDLGWATEAFGSPPEATNLWIGSDDSVTSFHKVSFCAMTGLKHMPLKETQHSALRILPSNSCVAREEDSPFADLSNICAEFVVCAGSLREHVCSD